MQQDKQINPFVIILCSNSYRTCLCLLYEYYTSYYRRIICRYALCYEWFNDTNSIVPTATAERLYRRPNDRRQWSIINNNKWTYSLWGWLINWSTRYRGRCHTTVTGPRALFRCVVYQTRSTLCAHDNNIIITYTC